jgi:hypothetical protein
MAVQCLVEIPGIVIAYYCIEEPLTGRKWTMFLSYLFTTLFSLVAYYTAGVGFVVWLSGIRLFSSIAFIVIY